MNDLKTTVSVNDIHSLKKLEAKVHMLHGRHEVPTFWKEQLSISKTKIEDIAKKIQDKNLFDKYNKKLDTHITRGYAKNSKDELTSASNKTWYLPQHSVFQPQDPGQVRVVFDAAATCKGKSLNTDLFKGPDLLNSFIGDVLRFWITKQHWLLMWIPCSTKWRHRKLGFFGQKK